MGVTETIQNRRRTSKLGGKENSINEGIEAV